MRVKKYLKCHQLGFFPPLKLVAQNVAESQIWTVLSEIAILFAIQHIEDQHLLCI